MIGFVKKRELVSEKYFGLRSSFVLDLPRGRRSDPERSTSKITISPGEIYDEKFLIPDYVEKALKSVSQLGLKELWVGGAAMQHNRWNHSRGVFNVGAIWLAALHHAKRVPEISSCFPGPFSSWSQVRRIVGSALLLHDFGHLPFSHLLDEVLQWIHWVPDVYEQWGSEAAILKKRLSQINVAWAEAGIPSESKGNNIDSAETLHLIEELILGELGIPWIQAIVNSPVDADKIDYIRFDSGFLRDCDFGVGQRLHLDNPQQWMTDFIHEQEVNHAGYLCLHGRSAIAAADLWRERMFMYDRFYLAPELRVAERMAFEIVQQFLIRSTMSSLFAKRFVQLPNRRYLDADKNGTSLGDSITPKYEAACSVMQECQDVSEEPELEFATLVNMSNALQSCKGIDSQYRSFLAACCDNLSALTVKNERTRNLRQVVDSCLVQGPITFDRTHFEKAREVIRPLQHTYCREALIDLVRMPRALAGPRMKWEGSGRSSAFNCPLIVPAGPVERWGKDDGAATLLGDECVRNLEIPICRAIVIAPDGNKCRRAQYVWDRLRSSLLDEGIEIRIAQS